MKISSENENFVRGGNDFFMRSSENEFFRSPGPLGRVLGASRPRGPKKPENNRNQEWPRQTKPKKGQFMNFSQGHSGTKVQCESCLVS